MPMRDEGLCVRGGAPMGGGARARARPRAGGSGRVLGPGHVRVRVGLAGRVCQCVRAVWSVLCGGRMVLLVRRRPFAFLKSTFTVVRVIHNFHQRSRAESHIRTRSSARLPPKISPAASDARQTSHAGGGLRLERQRRRAYACKAAGPPNTAPALSRW